MPTLIATSMALPQGTEQERDPEFELDIRISMPTDVSPQFRVGTNASCFSIYGNTCEATCDSCGWGCW